MPRVLILHDPALGIVPDLAKEVPHKELGPTSFMACRAHHFGLGVRFEEFVAELLVVTPQAWKLACLLWGWWGGEGGAMVGGEKGLGLRFCWWRHQGGHRAW